MALLKIADVARILSLNEETVRGYLKKGDMAGRLQAKGKRKVWVVPLAEVIAFATRYQIDLSAQVIDQYRGGDESTKD